MNRRCTSFAASIIALIAVLALNASAHGMQRLRVSANGRFLEKADGTPFFWAGDTCWRLYKLPNHQIDQYLQDRKNRGFNVIQGPVLLYFDTGPDFRNPWGVANDNPAGINNSWFSHIDYIVQRAAQMDMYVALVVTWGNSWHVFDTTAEARNFGRALGERYRNYNNVIWIVAGEHNIEGTSGSIKSIWNAIGSGLKQGNQGRHLVTAHGSYQSGRQSSSKMFHKSNWLDFNMIQSSQSGYTGSGADNWKLVEADYVRTPAKPTIDGEAMYEGIGGWDASGVRRRAYWSVFAGAFGHTYGAASVWQCFRPGIDQSEYGSIDPWNVALRYEGASDIKHLRRLMESRPMLKRIPGNNVIVGDAGGLPNHLHATRDSNGRYAMVYVPRTGYRFTVNVGVIAGNTGKAWWYDPRTGKATSAGNFAASGHKSFKTPNNGWDWVLVLDSASAGFPKPGVGGPLK